MFADQTKLPLQSTAQLAGSASGSLIPQDLGYWAGFLMGSVPCGNWDSSGLAEHCISHSPLKGG
jgi:hypothetical protein